MKIEQKFSKLFDRKMMLPIKLKSQINNSNEIAANTSEIHSGEALKEARYKSNQSLSQISDLLRIRQDYLKAIENGRPDDIPGTTYAIGFIKSYSNYLGIDPANYINSLKTKVQNPELKNSNVFPSPAPEGKIPSVMVIFTTILITGGIVLIWNNLQKTSTDLSNQHDVIKPQTNTITAVGEREKQNSDPRSSPKKKVLTKNSLQHGEKIVVSKTTPDNNLNNKKYKSVKLIENKGIEPTDSLSVTTKRTKKKSPETASINSSSLHETTDQFQAKAKTDVEDVQRLKVLNDSSIIALPSFTIQATADSWIQIKALDSNILLSRILKTHETYNVPNRNDLLLSTGNIGALVIRINGKKIPKYAGSMRVVKDIALTKENLLKTSDSN
jgi:cytoskeleton protein RodZ